MAPDQPAPLEVLHVPKTAKVDDRIRQAAETIYQALIEAELTAMTGAFPMRGPVVPIVLARGDA